MVSSVNSDFIKSNSSTSDSSSTISSPHISWRGTIEEVPYSSPSLAAMEDLIENFDDLFPEIQGEVNLMSAGVDPMDSTGTQGADQGQSSSGQAQDPVNSGEQSKKEEAGNRRVFYGGLENSPGRAFQTTKPADDGGSIPVASTLAGTDTKVGESSKMDKGK